MSNWYRKLQDKIIEAVEKPKNEQITEYHDFDEWKSDAEKLGYKIGKGTKSGQPVCYIPSTNKITGRWEVNDGQKGLIPNSGWSRGYIRSPVNFD